MKTVEVMLFSLGGSDLLSSGDWDISLLKDVIELNPKAEWLTDNPSTRIWMDVWISKELCAKIPHWNSSAPKQEMLGSVTFPNLARLEAERELDDFIHGQSSLTSAQSLTDGKEGE